MTTVGPSCFVPVIIIRYAAGGGTEKGKWAQDFLRQTKQVKLEPRFVEMQSEKREEWRIRQTTDNGQPWKPTDSF